MNYLFHKKHVFIIIFLSQFPAAFTQSETGNISYGLSNSAQLIEKVYLHTDRTWYYPGDDIWFKAYLVDAYYKTLTGNSGNLYVEFISPSQEIISSRTIKLEGGLGNGDFNLPADLPAGKYRIRAYTNYMRNFSDQLFFNKAINIIRPSAGKESFTGTVEDETGNIYISFFPEGGSLVDDVSSVVAFKAIDDKGRGVDVEGSVWSSAGNLVTMFRSSHIGMGSFAIKPSDGESYHAILKGTGNSELKADLPGSFPSGVILSVAEKDENNLSVIVRTNEHTLPGLKDDDLKLIVSVRKEIINTILLRISSLSSALTLPTEDLPNGIIMLTLVTSGDLPLAERLVYVQHNRNIAIDIRPDKEEYNQRDPVSLRVSIMGDQDKDETACLSFSATDGIYADNPWEYTTNISSWFLLESDVKGPVEGPAYYFDPANPDRFRYLDLLLMTQGWRDFAWKFDSTKYYLPENGFHVSGHIKRKSKDEPLPGSKAQLMIINGNRIVAETVPTGDSGNFYLDNIDINDIATLRASSFNKNDQPAGLLILDPGGYKSAGISKFNPSIAYARRKDEPVLEHDAGMFRKEEEMEQKYEVRESIRKKYRLSDTIEIGEIVVTAQKPKDMQTKQIESARMQYFKPDYEVIVTRELETVPAAPVLLMGTVPGVMVSGPNSQGRYSVRLHRTSYYKQGEPLLLVDGVERPFEVFNWIPVSIIDRIDVINTIGKTAAFGLKGNFGVISVITRIGNRPRTDTGEDPSVVNTTIQGYDSPRIFYSPRHDIDTPAGEPDLRTTLLWKPDIELQLNKEMQLDYFNADNSSTVRLTVEGITSTGIPVTGIAEYRVKE